MIPVLAEAGKNTRNAAEESDICIRLDGSNRVTRETETGCPQGGHWKIYTKFSFPSYKRLFMFLQSCPSVFLTVQKAL